MSSLALDFDASAVSTYSADVTLPALRFMRGGREWYVVTPTLTMALDLLPEPNPNYKFPNNRLLNPAHARQWGTYWEKNPKEWGCPAGLVSTAESLKAGFTESGSANGTSVGVLSLPRDFGHRSEILDMQHRIYGWHLKRREISDRALKLRSLILEARESGQTASLATLEAELARLGSTLKRFDHECITVEIAVMSNAQHRDLFSKIASKALPINATQIADFDESQAINRIARSVQTHPLLDGRIDWNKRTATDTKATPNFNLMSGATLADIVRPFALGHIVGRINDARNSLIGSNESAVVNHVNQFLNALSEAFPEFALADDGEPVQHAAQIRATSLLGSTSVLRVLATAYYRLTRNSDEQYRPIQRQMTHEDVVSFFKQLAPHMSNQIDENSPWLRTGVFPTPPEDGFVTAPGARAQELKRFAELVEHWALGRDLDLSPLV